MPTEFISGKRLEPYQARKLIDSDRKPCPLSDDDLIKLSSYLVRSLGNEQDVIREYLAYPDFPPDVVGMMVPHTYIHVNVRRSTMTLVAAALDCFISNGLLSAFLGLIGQLKTGVQRLVPNTGEFCAYVQAVTLKAQSKPISPQAGLQLVASLPCPFVKFNCMLKKGAICSAKKSDFVSLFSSLEEKGTLESNSGSWEVAI